MKQLKDLFTYVLPNPDMAEDIVMAISCLTAGYRQATMGDVEHFTHDQLLGCVGVDNAILMLEDQNYLIQDEDADEETTHYLIYVEE